MRAEDILQRLPAELLPGGEKAVKSRFKELAKDWHPDVNKTPEAVTVFEHLKRCRDYLLSGASKSILLTTHSGKIRYSYLSEHKLGGFRVLVGATTVSYLMTDDVPTRAAFEAVKHPWEFADAKQRAEMTRYLPDAHRVTEAQEGLMLSYHRSPGDVLLADLLEWHQTKKTRIPPKAIMWMVSGLLNLACYLEVSRVAHCAIREEFVVVNLDDHEVKLVGPAMFSTRIGHRPALALAETLSDFPTLRTKDYVVKDSRLDLTLIRSLVMRLLGHRTMRQVRADAEIPEGLRRWLESPPLATAIDDYVAWEEMRGKREFHIYGSSARDVYVSLL